jgi:GNAT superfamily N-acetyltransferase
VRKPDLDLSVNDDSGGVRARCSCWWGTGHTLDGESVGVIGHYSAESAEAGTRVLIDACAQLAAHGCTIAVGPMDGSTWRSYRLVIERGAEPPFFLEPDTPDAWVSHFTAAGFETLATYSSALARELTRRDPRIDALASRLAARRIVIRSLDLAHADEDLRRVFELSLIAFKDNFLYTPIDEAEFMEQNRRLLPVVRPELVLLAEHHAHADGDHELVAFLFAVPDVLQQKRGQPIDTIIIKTVAVKPGLGHAGLGSLLVAEAQQRAAALGYTRAVHALMHEQNVSRNISRRYAETIRRYALFAKRLAVPAADHANHAGRAGHTGQAEPADPADRTA